MRVEDHSAAGEDYREHRQRGYFTLKVELCDVPYDRSGVIAMPSSAT
jgi:hypothetical protein